MIRRKWFSFRIKPIREYVPLRKDESFLAFQYRDVDFHIPYHFHPEVEIVSIVRGSGIRVVGGQAGSFVPGELCLFGSGLPHCFHVDEASEEAVSTVLQFRPELIQAMLDLPEMASLKRLLQHGERGLHFSRSVANAATAQLQELTQPGPRNRFAQLFDLLNTLAADRGVEILGGTSGHPGANATSNRRMERVWDLILRDYDGDLSQAQVARALGMSISAFSRYFRRVTGRTFGETLIDLRLGKVCRLLQADDEMSIAEAGFAAGFNNLSIFNRHFRSRHGMTPREWRRRLRMRYATELHAD